MIQQPTWALCLGGADCVWEDVLAWETIYGRQWDGVVVAANDIGAHWPRDLHHWVSLHPNKFLNWHNLREQQRLPMEPTPVTWGRVGRARAHDPMIDNAIVPWAGGSSGFLAVQVAQLVGCTRAILCGIPMTPTAHFGETKEAFGRQWAAAAGHWRAWTRNQQLVLGWAKSMSGRTQTLLGAPTMEWLTEAVSHESHST